MNLISKAQTAFQRSVFCGTSYIIANGGGGGAVSADAAAVTGATIDTRVTIANGGGQGYEAYAKAGAIKFSLVGKTTLTADKTLSIACEYQTSTDGSTWATAVSLLASTVVATGALTNSAITPLEYDLSLESLPRYIRFNYTPDLSHTSTDTAILTATAILSAATVNPITRSAI